MSEAKSTKGPWIAVRGAGWIITRPDATERRECALAVGLTPATTLVSGPCSSVGWFDDSEAKANAELMAAAPDMYAALKSAEILLGFLLEFAETNRLFSKASKRNANLVRCQIMDALAKADGKEAAHD